MIPDKVHGAFCNNNFENSDVGHIVARKTQGWRVFVHVGDGIQF